MIVSSPTPTPTYTPSTNPTPVPSLLAVAVNTIQQSIDLLDGLDDDSLIKSTQSMPCGTLGKHIRHVYDHFSLLLTQLPLTPNGWEVDYDERSRNASLETNQKEAVRHLKILQERLATTASLDYNSPLTLHANIDPDSPLKSHFISSFGRELWFCCLHAIHHYASIKIICVESDIDVPEDFGMAPSTLQSKR